MATHRLETGGPPGRRGCCGASRHTDRAYTIQKSRCHFRRPFHKSQLGPGPAPSFCDGGPVALHQYRGEMFPRSNVKSVTNRSLPRCSQGGTAWALMNRPANSSPRRRTPPSSRAFGKRSSYEPDYCWRPCPRRRSPSRLCRLLHRRFPDARAMNYVIPVAIILTWVALWFALHERFAPAIFRVRAKRHKRTKARRA